MKQDKTPEEIKEATGAPAKAAVRVVELRGTDAALVEYQVPGLGLQRCVIPAGEIAEGEVLESVLELGVPYGVPWEREVTLYATSAQLAHNLRRAGIWTYADIQAHPQAAYGALQETYGIDFAAIIRAAEKHAEEV